VIRMIFGVMKKQEARATSLKDLVMNVSVSALQHVMAILYRELVPDHYS